MNTALVSKNYRYKIGFRRTKNGNYGSMDCVVQADTLKELEECLEDIHKLSERKIKEWDSKPKSDKSAK